MQIPRIFLEGPQHYLYLFRSPPQIKAAALSTLVGAAAFCCILVRGNEHHEDQNSSLLEQLKRRCVTAGVVCLIMSIATWILLTRARLRETLETLADPRLLQSYKAYFDKGSEDDSPDNPAVRLLISCLYSCLSKRNESPVDGALDYLKQFKGERSIDRARALIYLACQIEERGDSQPADREFIQSCIQEALDILKGLRSAEALILENYCQNLLPHANAV